MCSALTFFKNDIKFAKNCLFELEKNEIWIKFKKKKVSLCSVKSVVKTDLESCEN